MIRDSTENTHTPDSIHAAGILSSTTIITLMSILGILMMTMIDPITGYHEVAENLTTTRQSNLRLPTFIASHMVLQRGPLSARIWGWADPGANVSIALYSQKTTTNVFVIADQQDGSWNTMLPPQPAGSDHKIHITDGQSYIDLEDIAFGDVYLCSGQSNMEFSMPGVFNATAEIEDSINYPNIRLATVQKVLSDDPQDDVPSKASNYTWTRSSPTAMSIHETFGYYSAACYFFGRELHKALDYEVPIGLVTSSWGGQKIETFSSPEALADRTCGGTRPLYDVYDVNSENNATSSIYNHNVHDDTGNGITGDAPKDDDNDLDGDSDGPKSMQIWNAMIHPLINMRFTGAIWYQGEANDSDQNSYACRFPAMITDWRNKFDLPDLSFFFVQLAADHNRDTWPNFRAAQLAATQLPRVGFATAIDIGDRSSPHNSIHPRRKQEVGRRLALSVRSIEYGERGGLIYTGPTLAGVQFSPECCVDSSITLIRLSFSPGTADNLHVHGSPECKSCCSNLPFQVLNGDGNWTRVDDGSIEKSEIILSSRSGPVFGIRYAWEPYPQCLIYNGWGGPDDHTGLPSAPWEWCAYPSGDPTWSGNGCRVPTEARRYHIQRGLTETK